MIFQKIKKGLNLLLFIFLFEQGADAENNDLIIEAIRIKVENNSPIETIIKDICQKGKICRKNNKKSCESKIVLSLCWVICGEKEDFSKSHCVKTTAQNTLLFNTEQKTFSDGQTPAAYLVTTIESPSKTDIDASLLCNGICKIAKSAKNPLFLPGVKEDLKIACAKGCTKKLPNSASSSASPQ